MHERVGRCSPHAAGFEGDKLAAVVNTKCDQRLRTSWKRDIVDAEQTLSSPELI